MIIKFWTNNESWKNMRVHKKSVAKFSTDTTINDKNIENLKVSKTWKNYTWKVKPKTTEMFFEKINTGSFL